MAQSEWLSEWEARNDHLVRFGIGIFGQAVAEHHFPQTGERRRLETFLDTTRDWSVLKVGAEEDAHYSDADSIKVVQLRERFGLRLYSIPNENFVFLEGGGIAPVEDLSERPSSAFTLHVQYGPDGFEEAYVQTRPLWVLRYFHFRENRDHEALFDAGLRISSLELTQFDARWFIRSSREGQEPTMHFGERWPGDLGRQYLIDKHLFSVQRAGDMLDVRFTQPDDLNSWNASIPIHPPIGPVTSLLMDPSLDPRMLIDLIPFNLQYGGS